MSEKSSRGGDAEVAASAALDAEAAERFRERQKASRAENAQRNERRYGCLRDSALMGAAVGTISASLVLRGLRNPNAKVRFGSLLGITVSGTSIGGAGQAFCMFVGFFMPFVFVSSTLRWKCQKAGLQVFVPPRKEEAA